MHRSRIATTALTLIALLGSFSQLNARGQALTAEMRDEFGAAAWIPADAGFLGVGYRYREQWQAFEQTRAYQELLTMPVVQMGLAWIHQQPYLEQLAAMRAQMPLLDDGLNVLSDAISQEMFVYVDARGPEFVNELGDIYNSLFWNSFMQGLSQNGALIAGYSEQENQARLIRRVVDAQQQLRMPGVVFGFRLSDPSAGQTWIADVEAALQQSIPLPVQRVSLGDGEYLTVQLQAAMFLTPAQQSDLVLELIQTGVDATTVQEFVEFIKSQQLSISLGMRGDYLLLSIGADNSHLEALGEGVSLAESDALAPVRKHFKPRMVGLSYIHPDFSSYGKMDVEGTLDGLQEMLSQVDTYLPPGLTDRLMADATQLLNEVNDALPEASPVVAVSFWNRGFESFTFSAVFPGSLDSSEPLSILDHAGHKPMLALAGHAPPSVETYKQVIRWLDTLYGYFEDYAVPQIPPEELENFQKFESVIVPALQEFHETTRDLLLPSIDGGQGLFVLDAGGVMTRSPDDKSLLPAPIRFPRPAFVAELNDARGFVRAGATYRESFNALMKRLSEEQPEIPPVQIPPPTSRQSSLGTLYTYPIPEAYNPAPYLDDDFEPHVMLSPRYVALSLSPRHSEQLLAEHAIAADSPVDLQQPAGGAVWFDISVLTELVCDDAEAILSFVQQQEEVDSGLAVMIQLHVDKLRNVLGAVRSYRSRTYDEDGRRVTHGWLHLEDIRP